MQSRDHLKFHHNGSDQLAVFDAANVKKCEVSYKRQEAHSARTMQLITSKKSMVNAFSNRAITFDKVSVG